MSEPTRRMNKPATIQRLFADPATTNVVVEWEDSEGPKEVTFPPGWGERFRDWLMSTDQAWGSISLQNAETGERITWCDGTHSAARYRAERNGEAGA